MELNSNLYLFRTGIKPMWEDENNIHGGEWTLHIPSGFKEIDSLWVSIVLGVIGESTESEDGGDVNAVMDESAQAGQITGIGNFYLVIFSSFYQTKIA
jgi:translation initiation factor 4E